MPLPIASRFRLLLFLLLLSLFLLPACFTSPGGEPANGSTNSANNANNAATNNTATNGATNGTPCTPEPETCDGEDNDCDGEVDEDFDLGADCSVGKGACESAGELICSTDGTTTTCSSEEGTPGDELCDDGIDNDCDGEIDEGFDDLGDACSLGEGVCATDGTVVCSDDLLETVCDAMPPEPPEEMEMTCDELDNDCDGEVDEGCDDDGDGFCDEAFTVVSPDSDALCTNGGDDCDDEDAEVYPGAPGLCDGKDNDCSGVVDDIRAVIGSTTSFEISGFAASGLEHGPIRSIASDSGFCIYMTGGNTDDRSINEAHFDSATAMVAEANTQSGREEEVADIVWSGAECAAVVIERDGTARDARLRTWTPDLSTTSTNLVVDDEVFTFQDSWNASVEWFGGDFVVAYNASTGTDAQYVTLTPPFDDTDVAAGPHLVGNVGTFGELQPNPGTRDMLFSSNFVNITGYEFNLGESAVPADTMTISGATSRREIVAATVDGIVWIAIRDSATSEWRIRELEDTLTYGRAGAVGYGTVGLQDHIGRNLFATGPAGTLWFAEPIDEKIFALEPDPNDPGSVVATELVTHPAGAELLSIRDAGDDAAEVLWMTNAGNPSTNATFEVTTYTCH